MKPPKSYSRQVYCSNRWGVHKKPSVKSFMELTKGLLTLDSIRFAVRHVEVFPDLEGKVIESYGELKYKAEKENTFLSASFDSNIYFESLDEKFFCMVYSGPSTRGFIQHFSPLRELRMTAEFILGGFSVFSVFFLESYWGLGVFPWLYEGGTYIINKIKGESSLELVLGPTKDSYKKKSLICYNQMLIHLGEPLLYAASFEVAEALDTYYRGLEYNQEDLERYEALKDYIEKNSWTHETFFELDKCFRIVAREGFRFVKNFSEKISKRF